MSIISKSIIPVSQISMANMSNLDKDRISYVKKGLRRCGFLLGRVDDKELTEDDILKGLDHLWLGKPEKSIWKVVIFGNEMWACDFRMSFRSFMDLSADDVEKGTQMTTPRCLFCKEIIDINQPAGYHIYKQKCLIKWVDPQADSPVNGC